jgi:hypothetical protein
MKKKIKLFGVNHKVVMSSETISGEVTFLVEWNDKTDSIIDQIHAAQIPIKILTDQNGNRFFEITF